VLTIPLALLLACPAPQGAHLGEGWARTKVNGAIFRHDPLTSFGDVQVVCFYDPEGRLVLARRELPDGAWEREITPYRGNVRDAHNVACVMFDGEGRLHVAFDHHGHPLRYATAEPGSLELSELRPMVGEREGRVTYPEFHPLPDGDLLFCYRDGASGAGDLVLNRYDLEQRSWSRVQDVLVDGEGERNAYWQLHVTAEGSLHLSWVWRRTPDAATNSDLCYAMSLDGGRTWLRSDATEQPLPITRANAEVAVAIGEGSDLINTTSMTTDGEGRPVIASYWHPEGAPAPQYMLAYHDGSAWRTRQVGERTADFTLGGTGTRAVPIARPLVLHRAGRTAVFLRDLDREGRLQVATTDDLAAGAWQIEDLTDSPVGYLEPIFDRRRFLATGVVSLYVQRMGQGAGEREADLEPQPVRVLDWRWGTSD
jgi:hypothetical protein